MLAASLAAAGLDVAVMFHRRVVGGLRRWWGRSARVVIGLEPYRSARGTYPLCIAENLGLRALAAGLAGELTVFTAEIFSRFYYARSFVFGRVGSWVVSIPYWHKGSSGLASRLRVFGDLRGEGLRSDDRRTVRGGHARW